MNRLILTSLLVMLSLPALAANEGEADSNYDTALLGYINGYRAEHGLAPLSVTESLAALAREHSRYMAEQGDISHDHFKERFHRAGRSRCVENVGWNYRDAQAQFEGWQHSPGHDAAMLDPKIKHGGIAVFDAYVTFFACS